MIEESNMSILQVVAKKWFHENGTRVFFSRGELTDFTRHEL